MEWVNTMTCIGLFVDFWMALAGSSMMMNDARAKRKAHIFYPPHKQNRSR